MKFRCFIIMKFLLLFSLCFLLACDNDNNLMLMTYDSPNSAVNMTFGGEKYFWIGPMPNNLKEDQKIARVKTDEGLPNSYVYTIQGYKGKDFLIVEERTVGMLLDIYMHEKIKNIPWELLDGNVMINGDENIKFNNKNYYYFSKTSSDFLVDKEISKIKKDDKTIQVFKIKDQSESEWVAVKDEFFYKDGYLLYWVRGTSLPRQYAEFWRTYGK